MYTASPTTKRAANLVQIAADEAAQGNFGSEQFFLSEAAKVTARARRQAKTAAEKRHIGRIQRRIARDQETWDDDAPTINVF